MKACYMDPNNEANYDQLRRHGIKEVIYPCDPNYLTADLLVKAQQQGFMPSVFVAWNWMTGAQTGEKFALFCNERMKALGGGSPNPKLYADIEKGHGIYDSTWVDYLVAFGTKWRQLRPTRATDITFEPMQGALFNNRAADIAKLQSFGFNFQPQAYGGSMQPFESDAVLRDLLLYGFPANRISIAYDARRVGEGWDGALWTQGRLPS